MLDNFKETQSIAYKIVTNSVKKNKYSHAYIIENTDNKEALDFAISFAKYLFCPYGYSNFSKCGTCSQCKNIDDNNYLELKIINPEGSIIKKQELNDLQQIFKNKALIGQKKIYIINSAEKLNISSSNSILKFLEEPADNIIAILTTSNIYSIIPTILSRCQLITLNNLNKSISMLGNIDSEESEEIINNCLKFIYLIETKKTDAISYVNSTWNKHFKEKDKCILGLDIMINFYKVVLNSKLSIPDNQFLNNGVYIKEIQELNTIKTLCDKIKVIISNKERLKQNVNTSLLMDKLIIELKRCEEND